MHPQILVLRFLFEQVMVPEAFAIVVAPTDASRYPSVSW